jgi:urea transport system substrate-binding protein
LEQSPNIIYAGATANQQVIPAVRWAFDQLPARRYFLVGSDYVWPHAVHEIVKDQLRAIGAELVGEEYIPFGSNQVEGVVAKIDAAHPDVVLSTVVGETNLAFYQRLRRAGIRADTIPVISFSMAEEELRQMASSDVTGHYTAAGYFQSLDRPENREFVAMFRKRYGADRVINDAMATAYNGVRLWAQTVAEAGTDDVSTVRKLFHRQSLDAPEGIISVDAENQHLWRPFYLGRIRPDGQFDIVWSILKPIQPVPYVDSRSKDQWDAYLDGLYRGWGGRWASPAGAAGKTGSGS